MPRDKGVEVFVEAVLTRPGRDMDGSHSGETEREGVIGFWGGYR